MPMRLSKQKSSKAAAAKELSSQSSMLYRAELINLPTQPDSRLLQAEKGRWDLEEEYEREKRAACLEVLKYVAVILLFSSTVFPVPVLCCLSVHLLRPA